jgi:hypothetical protein
MSINSSFSFINYGFVYGLTEGATFRGLLVGFNAARGSCKEQ